MSFDGMMNWEEAKMFVDSKGWDEFLEVLRSQFPDRDIYKCSTEWYDDNSLICKAKGSNGDVIIGWSESNENIKGFEPYGEPSPWEQELEGMRYVYDIVVNDGEDGILLVNSAPYNEEEMTNLINNIIIDQECDSFDEVIDILKDDFNFEYVEEVKVQITM